MYDDYLVRYHGDIYIDRGGSSSRKLNRLLKKQRCKTPSIKVVNKFHSGAIKDYFDGTIYEFLNKARDNSKSRYLYFDNGVLLGESIEITYLGRDEAYFLDFGFLDGRFEIGDIVEINNKKYEIVFPIIFPFGDKPQLYSVTNVFNLKIRERISTPNLQYDLIDLETGYSPAESFSSRFNLIEKAKIWMINRYDNEEFYIGDKKFDDIVDLLLETNVSDGSIIKVIGLKTECPVDENPIKEGNFFNLLSLSQFSKSRSIYYQFIDDKYIPLGEEFDYEFDKANHKVAHIIADYGTIAGEYLIENNPVCTDRYQNIKLTDTTNITSFPNVSTKEFSRYNNGQYKAKEPVVLLDDEHYRISVVSDKYKD